MTNFRNVLKAYTLLRSLSDDETALLETLRNATEAERELLVEALGPVKKATVKRTRKAGKSARAASLASAIQQGPQQVSEGACTFMLDNGAACNTGDNNPIHDKSFGYTGYHAFQPAQAQAASGGD